MPDYEPGYVGESETEETEGRRVHSKPSRQDAVPENVNIRD
jgi:hypothetical protein